MRRPVWMALLICLVLALVVVLGVRMIASSEWLRDRVERTLIEQIRTSLDADVELKVTRLEPFSGVIEVAPLRIERAHSNTRLVSAERVLLEVRPMELLAGRMRVRALEADGLFVDIQRQSRSTDPDWKNPVPVELLSELSRLAIRRGALRIDDQVVDFELALDGLNVSGTPRQSGSASSGTISAGPVSVRLGTNMQTQRFDRLDGTFRWRPPRFEVTRFELTGPQAQLSGDVRVGLPPQGITTTGHVNGTLSLALLEGWIADPAARPQGTVDVGGTFRASVPGNWDIRLEARNASNIRWLQETWTDASAEVRADPTGFFVRAGTATSDRGIVARGLQADLTDQGSQVRGTAAVALHELIDLTGTDLSADLIEAYGEVDFTAQFETIEDRTRTSWQLDGDLLPGAFNGQIVASGDESGGGGRFAGTWFGADLAAEARWQGLLAEDWTSKLRLQSTHPRVSRSVVEKIAQNVDAYRDCADCPRLASARGLLIEADLRGVRSVATWDASTHATLDGAVFVKDDSETSVERIETELHAANTGVRQGLGRFSDADGKGAVWSLQREASGEFAVTATAEKLPLDWVVPWVQQPVQPWIAGASVDATLSGHWGSRGLEIEFVGNAEGFPDAWEDGQVLAEGSLRAGELRFDRLSVLHAGLDGAFEGRVGLDAGPWHERIEGELQADVDLSQWPADTLPFAASGLLNVQARLLGESGDDPLEADVAWADLELKGIRIPDGTALIAGSADRVEVDAQAEDARVLAEIDLEPDDPVIEGALTWTDTDLLYWLEHARGELSLSAAARSTGSLEFSGDLNQPESWSGQGRISALTLDGPTFALQIEDEAVLELSPGGRLAVSGSAPIEFVEFGGGRATLFGSVDLLGDDAGALAIRGSGSSSLQPLEVFDPDLIATGNVTGSWSIDGTLEQPELGGQLTVRSARLRLLTLDEAIDGVDATLNLDGDRIEIAGATARLGGGRLEADGYVTLDGWWPEVIDLKLRGRDVSLSIPRGVWGRYDTDLAISGTVQDTKVTGEVRIRRGRYTQPFAFTSLVSPRVRILDPTYGVSSWLSRIELQVALRGEDSFFVRNDTAQLETGIQIDLSGTLDQPRRSGLISIFDGGRVSFRGVDYTVLSGQMVLDDLLSDPMQLRLRASTEIRGYRIRVDLDATTENLNYSLSSVPGLPDDDILSLLITGQTLNEGGSRSGLMGSELATAYFGSELGELLLAEPIRRLFGLTHFQLAPSVVGPDSRPTARLTIGRRIDDQTLVLYSRDLSSESRDVYRLERELSQNLRATLNRETKGGVGVDLRWLQRFGEKQVEEGNARADVELDSVELRGLPGELEVKPRKLGLRENRPVNRGDLIDAEFELRRRLAAAGFIAAEVAVESAPAGEGRETVTVNVQPGPRWEVDYRGSARAVRRARELLDELWSDTQFRPELTREAERVLKDGFADDGFAAASVEVFRPDTDVQRLEVRVDAGPRVTVDRIEFEGARAIPQAQLRAQVLSRPGRGFSLGAAKGTYRPRLIQEDAAALRTLYESRGHLGVQVGTRVRFAPSGEKVVVTFEIVEGPQARVSQVRVEGNWPEDLGPATARLDLTRGQEFLPEQLETSRRKLERALDEAGFFESSVTVRTVVDDGQVGVTFRVQPGRSAVIEELQLAGLERTREKLVRRALTIRTGDPLSSSALRETERALFALGLFRVVEVTHEPVGGDPSARRVTIRFEEIPAISLLGTFGYDTEEKISISGSISHDNLTGRGRVGSLSGFASSLRRGVRAALEDPSLSRGRFDGLVTLGWQEDERNGFLVRTTSLDVQIGNRNARDRRWLFAYELKQDRFDDVTLDPDALQDLLLQERIEPIRLGSLSASWILDKQDDPFLPNKGWALRSEFDTFWEALASEAEFTRLDARISAYQPLTSRLTLAESMRTGFAWTTGDTRTVPLSERFFAGGANSLRGFERDSLGPLDEPGGNALGGEALLLATLELRWRMTKTFELSMFQDLGNVWLRPGDLELGDLRHAAGLEFRIRTGAGALRVGYGVKLDRGPFESSGEFYLSIGEPF